MNTQRLRWLAQTQLEHADEMGWSPHDLARELAQMAMEAATALEQAAPAMEMPMEMPDGDGYFAFEGRLLGSSVERLQWCVMVRHNGIDKKQYAWRFGGQTFPVDNMVGKWTRLTLPWEQRPATAAGEEYDHEAEAELHASYSGEVNDED